MEMQPNGEWTHSEAVELCRRLETFAPDFGAHVALTGGTLYKDGARKDADIVVYRIRQRALDRKGFLRRLHREGFDILGDYGWLQKVATPAERRPVDLLFPDYRRPFGEWWASLWRPFNSGGY